MIEWSLCARPVNGVIDRYYIHNTERLVINHATADAATAATAADAIATTTSSTTTTNTTTTNTDATSDAPTLYLPRRLCYTWRTTRTPSSNNSTMMPASAPREGSQPKVSRLVSCCRDVIYCSGEREGRTREAT
jgi:hypothetical protein